MYFHRGFKLGELPFTCDIHSHILPGVDDGIQDDQEAVNVLRKYQENGIAQVVFTPHVDTGMFPKNNESFLKERFKSFMDILPEDLHIQIHMAAEYMCNETLKIGKDLLILGKTGVLIEMSYFFQYPYIKETIFALMTAGYKPILAHPERYIYLAKKMDAFDKFMDMGCLFQLNLLSLSGVYGIRSKEIMHYLLRENMYSYAGSDVHSHRQFQRLKDTRLSTKLAAKVEELMNNNKELFS